MYHIKIISKIHLLLKTYFVIECAICIYIHSKCLNIELYIRRNAFSYKLFLKNNPELNLIKAFNAIMLSPTLKSWTSICEEPCFRNIIKFVKLITESYRDTDNHLFWLLCVSWFYCSFPLNWSNNLSCLEDSFHLWLLKKALIAVICGAKEQQ